MGRYKKYIDADVYEEAKSRLRYIFSICDSWPVMYSGGKDSLVLLHLVKEVQDELGLNGGIVDCVYHDTEFIPPSVDKLMRDYYNMPWVRMKWLTMTRECQRYILGKTLRHVEWDPARKHMRDIPEYALTNKIIFPNGEPCTGRNIEHWTCSQYPGLTCIMLGLRASESLVRYRACLSKVNDNYLTTTRYGAPSALQGKPIFDWLEDDIFKYLYDKKIKYAETYDQQMWCRQKLRVADMANAEAARNSIMTINSQDPEFYARAIEIYPEFADQIRYQEQLDGRGMLVKYGSTFKGVISWVRENITDPKLQKRALGELKNMYGCHRKNPQDYPIGYILEFFISGSAMTGHGRLQALHEERVAAWRKLQAEIDEEHKQKFGDLFKD